MSLPNYLAKIKSAGIYRFVWDKSQAPAERAETLRLVVGYSEQGPFNTPVYIDKTSDFTKIFGPISKKLEKRGIFFHRMALQALAGGPILALNLKKFLYDPEKREKGSKFDGKIYDQISYEALDPVWREDDTYGCITGRSDVKNVFNTNRFWVLEPDLLPSQVQEPSSLYAPKYLTLASTDSKETSCTIIMRGAAPSGYDVSVRTWYSNANEEIPSYLEGYENMLISDFFAEAYVFRGKFTKELATTEELKQYFDVVDDKVYLKEYLIDAFGNKVDTLDTLAGDTNSSFLQKYQGILLPYFKNLNGSYISLDLLFNADNDLHKCLMKLDDTLLDNEDIDVMAITARGWDMFDVEDVQNAINGEASLNNFLSNHEMLPSITIARYKDDTDDGNWEYKDVAENGYLRDASLLVYEGSDNLSNLPARYLDLGWAEGDRFMVMKDGKLVVTNLSKYEVKYDEEGDPVGLAIEFANGSTTLPTLILPSDDSSDDSDNAGDGELTTSAFIKCNHIITDNIGKINVVDCYLEGYTMDPEMVKPQSSKQAAKLEWQKNILSVLTEPGMFEALTNNTDVEYRLLVDTFESYVDTELKSVLSYLTRKKDNALAILNFPAVSTFVSCEYTHFTDSEGFKMKYVVEGGNKKKPIGRMFTLPTENNGASWAAFYTPIIITDGTVKTTVPSAALVSNLFMEKYESRHAYDVVAGPNYGHISVLGLVGPDYNYSRSDLDLLEPFGVNALVYVPRRGTQINSNQTAKQTPKSALSSVNVRELVIYLQDEIAYLLQSYHWELNTQPLRDTVKAKADTILENVQGNGGVYKFANKCDEDNNTDEVIDNEMLVLSTEIEPARGAGKMVEELTIYRKGGMSSSAQ